MGTGPRFIVPSDGLEKPGIEPATPGLQGKLIVIASVNINLFSKKQCSSELSLILTALYNNIVCLFFFSTVT